MTSSSSSSSSPWWVGLLAALALGGCGGSRFVPTPGEAGGPPPATAARLALFPVQNLTGGPAPTRELTAALRERLERRGIALASEDRVRQPLAARRIRYTGGLDREAAKALRDEAGVDGVIIASLETWGAVAPYRVAMTTRLVSTDPEPAIRWVDTFARSGVDAPGLLGLGIAPGIEPLRDLALDQVATSLAASLVDPRPATPCREWGAREPGLVFRSPLVADPVRRTIAVLPFVNDARRRDAGDVLALRFLAPLVANGTIQVVEPGVVRGEMLAYRFGSEGSISLDDASAILELVHADLVLSGTVRTFEDAAGATGVPRVDFGTWVLDRQTRRLVWASNASAAGDDGVYFFGHGRVMSASALACSMAKGVVGRLLRDRPPALGRPAADPSPPAAAVTPTEAAPSPEPRTGGEVR